MTTNPSNMGNPTAGVSNATAATSVGPAPGTNPTVRGIDPAFNTADPIAIMAGLMAQPGDANSGQASTPTPPTSALPSWIWLAPPARGGYLARRSVLRASSLAT